MSANPTQLSNVMEQTFATLSLGLGLLHDIQVEILPVCVAFCATIGCDAEYNSRAI